MTKYKGGVVHKLCYTFRGVVGNSKIYATIQTVEENAK